MTLIIVALFMFVQTGIIYWMLRLYGKEWDGAIADIREDIVDVEKAIKRLPYNPEELPEETLYGGTYPGMEKQKLDAHNGMTIEDLFSTDYDKDSNEAWQQIDELKTSA
jgi:hypothetical protein